MQQSTLSCTKLHLIHKFQAVLTILGQFLYFSDLKKVLHRVLRSFSRFLGFFSTRNWSFFPFLDEKLKPREMCNSKLDCISYLIHGQKHIWILLDVFIFWILKSICYFYCIASQLQKRNDRNVKSHGYFLIEYVSALYLTFIHFPNTYVLTQAKTFIYDSLFTAKLLTLTT